MNGESKQDMKQEDSLQRDAGYPNDTVGSAAPQGFLHDDGSAQTGRSIVAAAAILIRH